MSSLKCTVQGFVSDKCAANITGEGGCFFPEKAQLYWGPCQTHSEQRQLCCTEVLQTHTGTPLCFLPRMSLSLLSRPMQVREKGHSTLSGSAVSECLQAQGGNKIHLSSKIKTFFLLSRVKTRVFFSLEILMEAEFLFPFVEVVTFSL